MIPQRLSIEVTNKCQKGCSFCYNASSPEGSSDWTTASLVEFVLDCQRAGTEAVSFGGGEPLLFEGIFDVLEETRGHLFRSLTSNGLLLDDTGVYQSLLKTKPEKIHISIHDPADQAEVDQVLHKGKRLDQDGIRSGINLLVHKSSLPAARQVTERIRSEVIGSERVILIPRHGEDAPSADEVAGVAGAEPFQSVSCLLGCQIKPNFCAIGWDQCVGWCSYTSSRIKIGELSAVGLRKALIDLPLLSCETQLPRL